jgi:hypothetical protein
MRFNSVSNQRHYEISPRLNRSKKWNLPSTMVGFDLAELGSFGMGFEVFSAYGAASRDQATLRASGYLFVPSGMIQAIAAEGVTHVVLMYDKAATKLAIRAPRDDETPEVWREVVHEKSGIVVNIVPLLKTYKLQQPKKKVKLPAQVDSEQPWVVIDMRAVSETPF